jgi:hypothetical protein
MLSLVLSFVLAAVWVSATTVITERLGTKVGGVVTTLPSTLVVALYFMAAEEGTAFASKAAAVVPAEIGVNVIFLALFVAWAHRGMGPALAAAYAGWALLSVVVWLLDVQDIWLSMFIFAVCVAGSSYWLKRKHDYKAREGQALKYTPGELAFRGLFAGAMIALSVFLASVGGPVIAGIMAVFPAIFTSTMVILYLRQGRDFTGAAGRTMILGVVNVTAFAVLCWWLLPGYGAVAGILLALVLSYIWSFGTFLAMNRYFA